MKTISATVVALLITGGVTSAMAADKVTCTLNDRIGENIYPDTYQMTGCNRSNGILYVLRNGPSDAIAHFPSCNTANSYLSDCRTGYTGVAVTADNIATMLPEWNLVLEYCNNADTLLTQIISHKASISTWWVCQNDTNDTVDCNKQASSCSPQINQWETLTPYPNNLIDTYHIDLASGATRNIGTSAYIETYITPACECGYRITQYRCESGWYGVAPTCNQCPVATAHKLARNGQQPSVTTNYTILPTDTIAGCFISSTGPFADETGTYTFETSPSVKACGYNTP